MLILNLSNHIKNSTFIINIYINYLNNLIKLLRVFYKIEKQKKTFINKIKITSSKNTLNFNDRNNRKEKEKEKEKEKKFRAYNIRKELDNKKKFTNIVLNEVVKQIVIFKNSKASIKYFLECIKKLKKFGYKVKLKKILIENILRNINKEFETYLYHVHYIYFKVNKIKITKKNKEEIHQNKGNNELEYKSIGSVYTSLLYALKIKIEAVLNYIYNFCRNINNVINTEIRNLCFTLIKQNDIFFLYLKKRTTYLKEKIQILLIEENELQIKSILSSEKLKNVYNKNYLKNNKNKSLFHINELKNKNENKKNEENNNHIRNNITNSVNNSLNGITRNNIKNSYVEIDENQYSYLKKNNNKVKKEPTIVESTNKKNQNLIKEEHEHNLFDNKYIHHMKNINIYKEIDLKNKMNYSNIKKNNFKEVGRNKKGINKLTMDNNINDLIAINLDEKGSSMIYIVKLYKMFKENFKISRKAVHIYFEKIIGQEDIQIYQLIIYILNYYSSIVRLNSFSYKSLKSIIYDYRLSKDKDKRKHFLVEIYLLCKFQIKNISNIIKNYNSELKILYKYFYENNFFFIFIYHLSKFLGLNKNNCINYFCNLNNIKVKKIKRNLTNKKIILYNWRDHIKIRTHVLTHSTRKTDKKMLDLKDIVLLPYSTFFNDSIEENHNKNSLNQKFMLEVGKIYSKYSFLNVENEMQEFFEKPLKRNCIFKYKDALKKMSYLFRSQKNPNIICTSIFEDEFAPLENCPDLGEIENINISLFLNESNTEDEDLSNNKYSNIIKEIKKAKSDAHYNPSVSPYFLSENFFPENIVKPKKSVKLNRNMIDSDYSHNKQGFIELQNDALEENVEIYNDNDDGEKKHTELYEDESSFNEMDEDILNLIKEKYNRKKEKNSKSEDNEYLLESSSGIHKKITKGLCKKERSDTTEEIKKSKKKSTKCSFLENDNYICKNVDKEEVNAIMKSSINNYNCTLSKKVIIQGKIFITLDGLYFISLFNVLFLKNSILRIKYEDIKSIEKSTVLHFIPSSLKINTKNKTFLFISFVHRDHAYDLISDMIREKNNIRKIPKKGIVFHSKENYNEYDFYSDLNKNENEQMCKEKIESIKKEQLFPTKDDVEHDLHIDTCIEHAELTTDVEEKKILEENNYINPNNYVKGLRVNKNFKEIFLEIFANFDINNPLVKTVLDKKANNLSYEHIENLSQVFEKKKFLTYESVYNILLFDKGKRIFGLPERSNVKETINFFFFKNNISIQKSNTLLCNVPLAGCFRTLITINLHNVGELNNSTQIDFSYDIKFFKNTLFKSKIESNTLPKLEETVINLKYYTENAILRKFKKIEIKKPDVLIENKKENEENEKDLVSPPFHTNNDTVGIDLIIKNSDKVFKCPRNEFKLAYALFHHKAAVLTILISFSLYIFYKIIYR